MVTGEKVKPIVTNAGKFVGLTTEWGSYYLIASMFSVKTSGGTLWVERNGAGRVGGDEKECPSGEQKRGQIRKTELPRITPSLAQVGDP